MLNNVPSNSSSRRGGLGRILTKKRLTVNWVVISSVYLSVDQAAAWTSIRSLPIVKHHPKAKWAAVPCCLTLTSVLLRQPEHMYNQGNKLRGTLSLCNEGRVEGHGPWGQQPIKARFTWQLVGWWLKRWNVKIFYQGIVKFLCVRSFARSLRVRKSGPIWSPHGILSIYTWLQTKPNLLSPRRTLTCKLEVTVLVVGDCQTLYWRGLVERHPQALLQLHRGQVGGLPWWPENKHSLKREAVQPRRVRKRYLLQLLYVSWALERIVFLYIPLFVSFQAVGCTCESFLYFVCKTAKAAILSLKLYTSVLEVIRCSCGAQTIHSKKQEA